MITLTLEVPRECWISSNDRLHYREKARRTKELRAMGATAAAHLHRPMLHRCEVLVRVQYSSNRRADPPNSYPTVKAIQDGFTDAGVWPDDDSKHITRLSFERYETPALLTGIHRLFFEITPCSG